MQKRKYLFGLSIACAIVFFSSVWILSVFFLPDFLIKISPVEFATYHGDGYTVNYPKSWKVEKDKEFGYTGVYGNGGEAFFSTHDGSETTLSQQLDFQLSIFRLGFKNFKQIESKRTVNRKNGSWLESGGICDLTMKDGTKRVSQEVSVVTGHTNKAGFIKLFTLDYIADRNGFGSSEQKFFEPMWQSFQIL